jgi:hypothetical protein
MKPVSAFAALAFCIFSLYSCSSKLAPVGHFQSTAIVADGNTDDWQLPLRFSNAEYTYTYSVTNDNKNIYICILSKDPDEQLRILRSGISVYFDAKDKKNKNTILEFPVRKPVETGYNYNGSGTTVDRRERMSQLLLESNYYNTTGFAHIENGQFDISDKKADMQVAIKLNNDNALVYEAIIPLNDIPGLALTGKKADRNFGVGVVVNPSLAGSQHNNSAFRPSVGMRGMHMGMGRGGGQRTQQHNEEINWYEFRLAQTNGNE